MVTLLHEQALSAAKNIKSAESLLLSILQKMDVSRAFDKLGYPSLFIYVTKALGLSEASAQQLITVGRKARKVPALGEAIRSGELTISKAKAFVSVVTQENCPEWIERAKKCTTRELEEAVAQLRPGRIKRDSVRFLGGGMVRLSITVDKETYEAFKRCRELMTQKQGSYVSNGVALKTAALEYQRRHDPVQRADRAVHRTLHVKSPVHKVHQRDRGRCQFKLPSGELCGARHWLHIHHITPRSKGGSDEPENLITLCAAHHRQVHSN